MKRNNLKLLALTVGLSVMVTACGNETTTHEETTNTENTEKADDMVSDRDEDFVEDVLEANAEEMAYIRAAVNNGTDAEVKSAAQQMMTDHEKMDTDLRSYASSKRIALDDLDLDEDVDLDDEKGNDWDEDWAEAMNGKHKKLIRRFERAQDKVDDAALRDMIVKTLPVLRTHQETAARLEEKLDK